MLQSPKTGERGYRAANKIVFFKWILSNTDFLVSKLDGTGVSNILIRLRDDLSKRILNVH